MKYALSLITLAILSTPSLAQTNNQDTEVIEVTSNFRQVNLMKTQGSISVIGNNEIVDRNALHSEELLGGLANVNFSSGASRGNFVQIRGIGLRSQFVDSVNPSVGLLIDGINYSGLGGAGSLFDVEAFTLYRGPQGTQFGNDALAGVITIDSTAATAEQINRAQVSVGTFGSYSTGIAIGGAIADNFNVRLSAQKQESDGYIENDFLNRDDTNNIDESNIKLKTNWQVTDDLVIDTTLHYIDVDNGYDAFSLDQNRHTLSDEPGEDKQRTKAIGINALYTGLKGVDLQVIASSLDSDLTYSFDEDWSFVGIRPFWEYSYFDSYDRTREQTNVDLRLVSDGFTLFNNTTSWVGGVYISQRDSGLSRSRRKGDENEYFMSDNEHLDTAIYGQLTYQISPKTTMTFGARVGRYDIDYNDSQQVEEINVSENLYGFHFNLTNIVNEQATTYLTLSSSEKAGGVNSDALSKASDFVGTTQGERLLDNTTFDTETLYSAEFGVKGRSIDNKLTVKLAAFYNYRDNVQLKGGITGTINNIPEFVDYLDNADSGRGYGLEIETRYSYTDNLDLYYNVGYLITHIKDYVVIREGQTDLDLDNRNMAHAPEYQFAAGANYIHDSGFYANAEIQGKDSFYFSDSHNQQSDFYALTNISLGYQGNNWRVNLAANNIFDRDYATRGFYFGNDPREGTEYSPINYVQLGAPETVNLSVEVNW